MRARLTLLPFVAAVATISIAFRAPALYDSLSRLTPTLNKADAQEAAPKTAVPPPPKTKNTDQTTPAGAHVDAKAAAAGKAPAPLVFDPEKLTAGELDVLQSLAKRRTELDAREREINSRAALAAAAEARVDEKLKEVKAVEAKIAALKTTETNEQTAQVDRLVKIYQTMKPVDAAVIFNRLDMGILLKVARKMPERKFALILAAMKPERANALTVKMAAPLGGKGVPMTALTAPLQPSPPQASN